MYRLTLLILFFALQASVFAGVKIVTIETDEDGDDKVESIIYMTDSKFMTEYKSKDPMTMIFDNNTKDMIMIDHDKEEYTVISEEDFKKLQAQLDKAMTDLENQIAQMPAAQRKMMEGMMRKQMDKIKAPVVNYKATNQTKNIEGHNSKKYIGDSNGEIMMEIWVTEFSNFGLQKSDFAVMQEFADYGKSVMERFGKFGFDFSGFNQTIDGIPVKTYIMDDGDIEKITTLVSAEKKSIDESVFEIPEDYDEEEFEVD